MRKLSNFGKIETMLTATINGVSYDIPNQLSEITLAKFLELCRYEKKAPLKMQQIWHSATPEIAENVRKSITSSEYYTAFIPYYAGWLSTLFGVPAEELMAEETDEDGADLVENLYSHLHRAFDRSQLRGADATATQIEHEQIVYHLPDDFMRKSSMGLFTTCGQLQDIAQMSDGNYAFALPKICAVLLNTKKGVYPSEEQQETNAKAFLTLTMEKVWRVDFFLHKRLKNFNLASRIYTATKEAERLSKTFSDSVGTA